MNAQRSWRYGSSTITSNYEGKSVNKLLVFINDAVWQYAINAIGLSSQPSVHCMFNVIITPETSTWQVTFHRCKQMKMTSGQIAIWGMFKNYFAFVHKKRTTARCGSTVHTSSTILAIQQLLITYLLNVLLYYLYLRPIWFKLNASLAT